MLESWRDQVGDPLECDRWGNSGGEIVPRVSVYWESAFVEARYLALVR